jgi:hypothetical protein
MLRIEHIEQMVARGWRPDIDADADAMQRPRFTSVAWTSDGETAVGLGDRAVDGTGEEHHPEIANTGEQRPVPTMLVNEEARTIRETLPPLNREELRNYLLELFLIPSSQLIREPIVSSNDQPSMRVCSTEAEEGRPSHQPPMLRTRNSESRETSAISPGTTHLGPAVTTSPLQDVEQRDWESINESQSWIERREWTIPRRHCRSAELWCPEARNKNSFEGQIPREPISRHLWRL